MPDRNPTNSLFLKKIHAKKGQHVLYNRTVVQYAEEIIYIPLIHIELEIILISWPLFRVVYLFFTLHILR